MSYFEEAKQKAREVAAAAAEKARAAADSAKISTAIMAEKRELDKSYRAIGQWYACEDAGNDVPEAIADVVAAVRASQEKIAELQASREAAETSEAVEAAEGEGVSCPVCGKISATKFCPHCGAPMEETPACGEQSVSGDDAPDAAAAETAEAAESAAETEETASEE